MRPPGPEIDIGRLALRAPWLEVEQARELARRIAGGLAGAAIEPGGSVVAERVSLSVAGRAGEGVDALAERIVAALLRELTLVA